MRVELNRIPGEGAVFDEDLLVLGVESGAESDGAGARGRAPVDRDDVAREKGAVGFKVTLRGIDAGTDADRCAERVAIHFDTVARDFPVDPERSTATGESTTVQEETLPGRSDAHQILP